jgi:hypothetical protein
VNSRASKKIVALCAALFIASSLCAQASSISPDDSLSENSFELHSLRLDIAAARVGTFFAFGLHARAELFRPFCVGVRLSYDADAGSLYTIPYVGVTLPKIGGAEIGRLFRPDVTSWTVPYWETWRVWIGDETSFTLGASVLSNTPLNAVGYYDVGVSWAFDEQQNMVWAGLASLGGKGRTKGPAVKLQWCAGAASWLLAQGSAMIGAGENEPSYSVMIGWKTMILE